MSAEATLNTALLAHGGLTMLVGSSIYNMRFPPGTLFPAVVFQRVFTIKEQVVTGAVVSRSVRFQVMCYSEETAGGREATAVALQVEEALVVEGIGRFVDVTLRDEKAVWNPVAKLYEHMIEADCLEIA